MNTSRIRKLLLPFFLIFALGSTALYAANTSTASSEKLDDQYETTACRRFHIKLFDWNLVNFPTNGECSNKKWNWF